MLLLILVLLLLKRTLCRGPHTLEENPTQCLTCGSNEVKGQKQEQKDSGDDMTTAPGRGRV